MILHVRPCRQFAYLLDRSSIGGVGLISVDLATGITCCLLVTSVLWSALPGGMETLASPVW